MKTKKILSALILSGLMALPMIALAIPPEPSEGAPTVATTGTELIALITRLGNWAFAILMAVAGVFLIYAGFLWVTAGGNPEGATKARTMLINALIGVVVALLARGLVQVLKSIIGT